MSFASRAASSDGTLRRPFRRSRKFGNGSSSPLSPASSPRLIRFAESGCSTSPLLAKKTFSGSKSGPSFQKSRTRKPLISSRTSTSCLLTKASRTITKTKKKRSTSSRTSLRSILRTPVTRVAATTTEDGTTKSECV